MARKAKMTPTWSVDPLPAKFLYQFCRHLGKREKHYLRHVLLRLRCDLASPDYNADFPGRCVSV
jgi:hypothetical protein